MGTGCGLPNVGRSANWHPFFVNFPESHYASNDYISSPQNWDFVQDERGIMYVANSSGILEYDGHQWRMIPNSEKKFLLDLARDSTGSLFAGGRNDLGYLGPDSTGRLAFQSLLSELPDSLHQFGQIQSVLATLEGVIFVAPNHVFYWNGEVFKFWYSKDNPSTWIHDQGENLDSAGQAGLVQPQETGLQLVSGI